MMDMYRGVYASFYVNEIIQIIIFKCLLFLVYSLLLFLFYFYFDRKIMKFFTVIINEYTKILQFLYNKDIA